MSKFTPGPWWVVCGDESDDWAHQWPTIMSSAREICGTEGFYGDLEEDKANAALAADAPALLDALVLAERTLCEQEDSLRSMGCHEINAEPAILTARALIAKHGGGV